MSEQAELMFSDYSFVFSYALTRWSQPRWIGQSMAVFGRSGRIQPPPSTPLSQHSLPEMDPVGNKIVDTSSERRAKWPYEAQKTGESPGYCQQFVLMRTGPPAGGRLTCRFSADDQSMRSPSMAPSNRWRSRLERIKRCETGPCGMPARVFGGRHFRPLLFAGAAERCHGRRRVADADIAAHRA